MNSMIRSVLVIAAALPLAACVTSTQELPRPAASDEAARANMNLGAAYLRQGNPQLALDKLERALELNPRLAPAHSTIAVAYDQLGDSETAERHYRRATQLAPDDAEAQNSYAVFLCRRNRWEDAQPYFDRAVANLRYSTPEVALTNAGVCAQSAGDIEDAERYFRRALERNPRFVDALTSLFELELRQGDHLAARAFMQRAFDLRTPTARELSMCVRNEIALGDADAAETCMDRLSENYPRSAELAQLREQERDALR